MKTTELKDKLIDEINQSNNKGLLEEFYNYLNKENKIQKKYQLNSDQLSAVEEARAQIKNGTYLTNEQANQKIEEWLDK
jgi:hypothetical protein